MLFKKTMTIKQCMTLCLALLIGVSVAQSLVTFALEHSLRTNGLQQRMMSRVQTSQMLGDMKHDGIQGDIYRLIDAAQRQDGDLRRKTLAGLAEDIEVIEKAFDDVYANTYPEVLQARVDASRPLLKDYVAKAQVMADRLGSNPQDTRAQLEAFSASFDSFEKAQEELAAAIQSEIDTENAWADNITYWSVAFQLLTVAAMIAAFAISMKRIRVAIIEPVSGLADRLWRMARGDYTVSLSGDVQIVEIAEMATAARVFQETAVAKEKGDREQQDVVSALTSGLERLAHQDLEYRLTTQFPPQYEALRTNYNSVMESLSEAIGTVRCGSVSVLGGIEEIRAASDDLAQRNEMQAASIAEATHEASSGGDVVRRAVSAMATIEQSAREISQIVSLIDGIALQTNLLALNAGVEAARAGDAGKGFAVVAKEVRDLALRSTEAAKNIKELVDNSTGQVAQGVALVGETGTLLERIVERVSAMNSVTQQNAAMVEESTAATRSLADEATRLTQAVQRFRIAESGYSASPAPRLALAS